MSKSYQYTFKPRGIYADEVLKWLEHQPDKSQSLKLLIHQACRKYGVETNILELTYNNFADDTNTNVITTQPVVSTSPDDHQTSSINDNNDISEKDSINPQTETNNSTQLKPNNDADHDNNNASNDAHDTINIGFLSH